MAKEKVKEAVAVVEEADPNKDIEVNLDENNQVVKPEVKKVEEPKYVRAEDLNEAIRKSNAAFFAEQRKTQARLDEIAQGIKPKAPDVPQDEWDEKIQKDWKGTVRELARLEAQELRKQEIETQRVRDEETKSSQLLENNKRTVMQRHPELEDVSSEKYMLFRQIVEKTPDYKTNPFGPVLAMRDMEDELRSQGKLIDEPTKKIVDNEVNRRARTSATVVPNGNGSSVNKIVLTKDEKQYCDDHRIKYETFASTKQKLSTQREIEA